MTREIGDILIQEVLDHKDYEVERKIKLIEKIEKLVMASLNIASRISEHKAETIASEEEAKEMLQNGSTVRETQEATGLSYRKTAKLSAEIHKQDNVQIRATKADNEPITSDNMNDNNADNKVDNETITTIEMSEEDKPVLEVATYRVEDEKAIAMKRLAGLTGLKRAAMAATIERYFKDRQTFDDAYKDDPGMKFAYTLDDYINGARYNIVNSWRNRWLYSY